MHEKLKIPKISNTLEIHTRFNEAGNDKMERLFIFIFLRKKYTT